MKLRAAFSALSAIVVALACQPAPPLQAAAIRRVPVDFQLWIHGLGSPATFGVRVTYNAVGWKQRPFTFPICGAGTTNACIGCPPPLPNQQNSSAVRRVPAPIRKFYRRYDAVVYLPAGMSISYSFYRTSTGGGAVSPSQSITFFSGQLQVEDGATAWAYWTYPGCTMPIPGGGPPHPSFYTPPAPPSPVPPKR